MMKTDDNPALTPRSMRPVVAALAAAGIPVTSGMLHPILGEIVFLVELVVVLTLVGAALFGSLDLSERAFRLLRWIGIGLNHQRRRKQRAAGGDAGQPAS